MLGVFFLHLFQLKGCHFLTSSKRTNLFCNKIINVFNNLLFYSSNSIFAQIILFFSMLSQLAVRIASFCRSHLFKVACPFLLSFNGCPLACLTVAKCTSNLRYNPLFFWQMIWLIFKFGVSHSK
jgi:hypothetical protein